MNKTIKLFIIINLFALILRPVLLKAQDSPTKDFLLTVDEHAGYIIAQHSYMQALVKGHIFATELNYVFRTNGKKPWQQIHKYPEIGMCIVHIDLANPQQLGTLQGIYPYANLRLNNLNKRMALNLRLGAGLCYITKDFNRITDHQDNAIGSHVNAFVNLRLNTTVMLTKALRLEGGIGLSHASNGAFRTPNLGLNMATINLGLGYAFGNKNLEYRKDSIAKAKKVWHPSIIGVFGIKELMPPGTQRYTSYGLMVNFYHTINHKNKIGGGLETSYCNSLRQYLEHDDYATSTANILRTGVKFCYAFSIDRLSLPIDFGVYVYNTKNYDGWFFHRIGLRYMITDHIIANLTLITHWAVADYFEWGIGYQL